MDQITNTTKDENENENENEDEDDDEDESLKTFLDISCYNLEDLNSIELPTSLTVLNLTANRLKELDPRIGDLSNLKILYCGRNLFGDSGIESISHWDAISDLHKLVLRNNQLKKIPDVSKLKRLIGFDISCNEISSLNGLSKISNKLEELNVSINKVTKIEKIEHFRDLQLLEIYSNKIQVMENLQNLKHLQELWLGQNLIRVIDLCGLKCIKKLDLQSNRLTSIRGLKECVTLEELYLSHNNIVIMEGLSTLVNLRLLNLSSNKINAINGINNLRKLEDLWLDNNQIASLVGIGSAVGGSRLKLISISLDQNPCAKTKNYVSTLRSVFPRIQQVDSTIYGPNDCHFRS